MHMLIETEISENMRAMEVAFRTQVPGVSALETQQRAQGEFLRKLVERLQPMLRASMRSRRMILASDAYGKIALKSDGIFVHVDIADQEDAMEPLQVLRAEPSLLTLLTRMEAELVTVNDPHANRAADIVLLARHALAVAATQS